MQHVSPELEREALSTVVEGTSDALLEKRVLQTLFGARMALVLVGFLTLQETLSGAANVPSAAPVPAPIAMELLPEEIEPEAPALSPSELALAQELRRMGTLHAEQFVGVIARAVRDDPSAPSLTALLALAKQETDGDVLDVSEAGAVGLPQATPIALLASGYEGPLFMTEDYAIGSRAYYLKKPLGDADTIATFLVEQDRAAAHWAKAEGLLASAKELRTVGIEDLSTLTPYVDASYLDEIAMMDARNHDALEELDALIAERAPKKKLTAYRDDVRVEYRALRSVQRTAWKRYMDDLISARNERIAEVTGKDQKWVKRHDPYSVSAELATLDGRFDVESMAGFLRDHYLVKRNEVCALGVADEDVEQLTWRDYNGGLVNLLRIRAGLIGKLTENDGYIRNIARFKARLDKVPRPPTLETPAVTVVASLPSRDAFSSVR